MKKWPRTQHALERYVALITLMADNCRLFNADNPEYIGYANSIQVSFQTSLVTPARFSACACLNRNPLCPVTTCYNLLVDAGHSKVTG